MTAKKYTKKLEGRAVSLFCQFSLTSPSSCLSSLIGSLSKGVFERRMSTGSEVFFVYKHLDAPKFVFLSVLTIIETSCPKVWAKPLSKNEKRPLPVDVRRSKTSLLKFTNIVLSAPTCDKTSEWCLKNFMLTLGQDTILWRCFCWTWYVVWDQLIDSIFVFMVEGTFELLFCI